MDKSIPGPAPGLLYVSSKVICPEKFSTKQFDEWYEEVHIPDIFNGNGIVEASRWRNADPKADRPRLALYPLQDVNYLQSNDFKAISVEHESIPDTHKIYDFANFDTRSYKAVQLFAPEDPKPGQSDFVMSAAFTPADDRDYDNWYRQEHLKEISAINGWRKTERYELLGARENRKSPEENSISRPPKYLTLHYFDGEKLPLKELAAAGESEWTQRSMSTMKETEITAFSKLAYYRK